MIFCKVKDLPGEIHSVRSLDKIIEVDMKEGLETSELKLRKVDLL